MNLDDGGIDHRVLHIRIVRARGKKPSENIGFHPIAVSFEDRVPIPEGRRKIAPGTSCPRNPKHRFDKKPIILAAPPGIRGLAQAVRFHPRPLGVGQNESSHPQLESQPTPNVNPESQQTLGQVPEDHQS